jgi:hypothetical protein
MKRRIIGIFLLCCFIAPVVTTYYSLNYHKKLVKKSVKWKMIEGIDREELVKMKFTEYEKQNLLKWKHSREFEYKGEMYDIVESYVVGDTTHYWLWWDHEETKLNRQLDDLVSNLFGNSPRNQESQKKLSTFYQTLYFEKVNFNISLFPQKIILYLYYQNNYKSVYSVPPDPPPRYC